MKKQLLKSALITVTGVGLLAGSAMAYSFDVGANSTVTGAAVETDNGLLMKYSINSSLDSIIFDLAEGDTYTFLFATFWTEENSINPDDKNPQSINANIDFDMPELIGSVPGNSVGTASGFLNFYQGWKITWNDPVLVNFGNQGQFSIDLNDVSYSMGLWLGPDSTQCYGGQVFATITLNKEPVPEPTTMLLFGTGLLGLAGITRQRKIQ